MEVNTNESHTQKLHVRLVMPHVLQSQFSTEGFKKIKTEHSGLLLLFTVHKNCMPEAEGGGADTHCAITTTLSLDTND